MLFLNFIRTSIVHQDCTASYNVELNIECTVKELIENILKRNEWGDIKLKDTSGKYNKVYKIEYKNDNINDRFDDNLLNKKVINIKAIGGYGYMDYLITI